MTKVKRFGKVRQEGTTGAVTCWAIVTFIETKVVILSGKIKLKLCYILVYM